MNDTDVYVFANKRHTLVGLGLGLARTLQHNARPCRQVACTWYVPSVLGFWHVSSKNSLVPPNASATKNRTETPNAQGAMTNDQVRYALVMCAMEEEARYLRDRMNDCSEVPLTGAMRRTRGTIGGVMVDLVISGIGGVYATMATTAAILDRKPIAVFSCGCSGAHVRELRMGDVVLASEVKPLDAVVLERSGKVRLVRVRDRHVTLTELLPSSKPGAPHRRASLDAGPASAKPAGGPCAAATCQGGGRAGDKASRGCRWQGDQVHGRRGGHDRHVAAVTAGNRPDPQRGGDALRGDGGGGSGAGGARQGLERLAAESHGSR